MICDEIRQALFDNQDIKYRDFQGGLIPTADIDNHIGVRTPVLRKLAKEFSKREDVVEFLGDLPHKYFDENQIHAFLISEIKDFDKCIEELKRFLPYIDNWATCDQMSPKCFKKNHKALLPYLYEWIESKEVYTVRFAIVTLMGHFLDEDFQPNYLELVASVKSDEYYINMAIAWYFATALSKQYDNTLPFIEGKALAPWTHNKTIQKAIESFRVPQEHKDYLRGLKVKIK